VKALSIRQPWAWLIVNGHKDIENRSWTTRFRGEILVHASKGMTQDEYLEADIIAAENGVTIPPFKELERGGIVGKVTITDCVSKSDSPWYMGQYGFVLKGGEPLPFQPYKGALGFFEVKGGEA
jgi:hypothetical protein